MKRSILLVPLGISCIALAGPKPPPAQVSSSEGAPPLPYPVVPQKRQEKKNPPQPTTLITKIRSSDAEDRARTPNDLNGLIEWMSAEMAYRDRMARDGVVADPYPFIEGVDMIFRRACRNRDGGR